jgi:uncharacterized protein RhaS with RHS repeats
MLADYDNCSDFATGLAGGRFAAGQCDYFAITDNIFTGSRAFAYDALNRLTQAVGYYGANQAFTSQDYIYKAIGNILSKGGVNFTYGDAMHPSAVTSISSGKSYAYDANDNMITRGNQTLVWDIDNRVSSISIAGGGSANMQYDYSGMRVRKDGNGGTTIYPFSGYEIDPGGTITRFIRIGIETFASKKTTSGGSSTQYFYHNDHLGSVNVITDSLGARVQLNEYDPLGRGVADRRQHRPDASVQRQGTRSGIRPLLLRRQILRSGDQPVYFG